MQEEAKMTTPFAVEIYHRYLNGETVEELARRLEIPADRVSQRIRAAAKFLERQRKAAA